MSHVSNRWVMSRIGRSHVSHMHESVMKVYFPPVLHIYTEIHCNTLWHTATAKECLTPTHYNTLQQQTNASRQFSTFKFARTRIHTYTQTHAQSRRYNHACACVCVCVCVRSCVCVRACKCMCVCVYAHALCVCPSLRHTQTCTVSLRHTQTCTVCVCSGYISQVYKLLEKWWLTVRETWLIRMWDMTHPYVRHDPSICEIGLSFKRNLAI